MCYYPRELKPRISNDGEIIKGMLVPCGHCLECLQSKRAGWSFRLKQELKKYPVSFFVTLTYSNENLPQNKGVETLSKKHLQNYLKRVRADSERKFKYYAVGEYGSKGDRPHYHLIVFNGDRNSIVQKWSVDGRPIGHVHVGNVTEASIHYVTGYVIDKEGIPDYKTGLVHKRPRPPGQLKPFAIMSKGLGVSYVDNARDYHLTNATFKSPIGGYIPRYLKQKIFLNDLELKNMITEHDRLEIQRQWNEEGHKGVMSARAYTKYITKQSQKNKKL